MAGRAPSRREPLVPRRKPAISIAIPSSLVSDVPHLREKTARIGLIGRAAAIFRVDEIIIYRDLARPGEGELIKAVLTYMETPQYLRKRLIGLRPELRYVGILPPLRTPHHPLRASLAELRHGEFREGVVVGSTRAGCLVDVGVEEPLLAPGLRAPEGTRMTFLVERRGRSVRLRPVQREEVPYYWGYRVLLVDHGLRGFISKRGFDLVLGTSRLGRPIQEVADELARTMRRSDKVLVLFGSPSEGLYDMAAREGIRLQEACDLVVNTIPDQGVATVRTEEAVLATLAVLNFISVYLGGEPGRAPPHLTSPSRKGLGEGEGHGH